MVIMNTSNALIIMATIFCALLIIQPVFAAYESQVGVREGDWVEYSANITGGIPPPKINIDSFRIEVLTVEGTAFQANVTTRYVNGTVYSALWSFNFTEGDVGGWVIIPANLGAGDSFYDSSKPGNVTIEGEQQKTVAGATRTITYASDSKREVKEWDKATGVYTYSVEHPKNLTLTTTATATNLWTSNVQVLNQASFYPLIAAITLAAVTVCLTVAITKKKNITMDSSIGQKVTAAIVLVVLLLIIGAVGTMPLNNATLPLSFREINVIMQSFWTSLLIASMWFRRKGNYFLHEILMVIVVAATLISFSLVLFMSPPGSTEMEAYFSTSFNTVVFFAHAIFSLPAIAFGVWLVTLWRPASTSFPAKSKRIAQLTMVFWVISYVVGILDYLLIRNRFF